ncbi:hypothetical protein [Pedobacter heparinus]|uniref:hypothetical protein n=1 Tax=Pedobacter heparinus TaxID=984 RepID=UPI00292CD6A3|nr:hypothetical protein [Pedobacter heparinus]
MADEVRHPAQGSKFDKVFRENMQGTLPGIIKHVLSLQVTTIEDLADDIQFTKERKTDLLKKVIDNQGNTYVLHVEYQTDHYKDMHFRSETVLEQIVHEIESKSTSELEQGRYFRQLRVLLQLRNLDKQAIKDMALTGKIFKEEKDILYIRGEMKGEQKKSIEMAIKLIVKGMSVEEIADLTGLTIEEIQALS